jgi:uncharacterized protein YqgC (DUF456 family)
VEILTQVGLPIITLTLMLFGLFSLIFVPILPSLVVMWAGPLLFGLLDGFHTTASVVLFAIITLLMVAGSLVDNLLMGAGARRSGASWTAITIALVAGMVGSLFLPLFGGILLSLVALFALEYYRQRNWRAALDSTKSMALGCGWAVVARFALGLVMIGLYLGWLFWAR